MRKVFDTAARGDKVGILVCVIPAKAWIQLKVNYLEL